MSLPRPTLPYSDALACLRVRPEKGGGRTIYACDWNLWRTP